MTVPEYIERRIRSPIPEDYSLVPKFAPVVAFGDPTKATIATLGISLAAGSFLTTRATS